jgi:hypothetical protein
MAVGDTINANDPFAALRTSMNSILNGTGVHGGYNQSHSITANPSSGNLIDDAYFDSLRSAAAKIANYYNITNPFPAVNAGDLVRWSDYAEDATTFKTDIETRFNSPWSYSSGWDMTTATETTQSVSNWNGTRTQVVRCSFGSRTNMDAWFAAGGELRVSMSHNDTTTNDQGTSWEQLTGEMGTYRFSVRPTDTTTLDASTRKKYSDLTTSWTYVKREYANDANYSANYADIAAYISGSDLYIQIRLVDAHSARSGSGSGYDGPWSWTGADQAVGTSTVNVSSLKLSNASGSVNLTNPTCTVTDAL